MTKKQLTEAIMKSKKEQRAAFVPYIMAGDGGLEKTKKDILFLQKIGVTAIELGIPFSDPVADGPVIQAAGERALKHDVTLRKVIEMVQSLGDRLTIPIVVMTYLNPIIQYGIEDFVADCSKAGISGIIVPDLPLEEELMLKPFLQKVDIALIPLVSLTSPIERIEKILGGGEGFIYAVTVNGITGIRNEFGQSLNDHLANLKKISTIPVLAGFGVSTAAHVKQFSNVVDGVIVGSAIVGALYEERYEDIQLLVNASKKKVV